MPDLLTSQLVSRDIHSVSSLLKMYFRELPDPVCTFTLYDQFVAAVQSTMEEEERAGRLRQVLALLPEVNYRTLGSLVRHLHRVSGCSDSTGMTARNLAIVWAPNLLRYHTHRMTTLNINLHTYPTVRHIYVLVFFIDPHIRCRALEEGGPGFLAGVGVQVG